MKSIVGLGNPGTDYERTRHNAGFLALDLLAKSLDADWKADKAHKSLVAKTTIDGQPVLLAKPQTFMNLSGEAVQGLASYYKIEPTDILVIQDELDLEPGMLAFLAKGGNAGHNGIASIQQLMNRDDIVRLRIGVGRPKPPIAKEDWVLGKIEQASLDTIMRAPDAIKDWATHGLAKAMNTWNRKT
jgi:PTH1 family peptidyl-tRNA hydrolase